MNDRMNDDEFWRLVTSPGGGQEGDCEKQAGVVVRRLHALPAGDIAAFKRSFQEQMNRAYSWDLWGAAFIINGGCSDDGFEYFRAWLIMQARDVFEAAIGDPESLLEVVHEGGVECEDVLYAPFAAYEAVAGQPLLPDGPSQPKEPSGTRWEEDDLDVRFPRLTAAFG